MNDKFTFYKIVKCGELLSLYVSCPFSRSLCDINFIFKSNYRIRCAIFQFKQGIFLYCSC